MFFIPGLSRGSCLKWIHVYSIDPHTTSWNPPRGGRVRPIVGIYGWGCFIYARYNRIPYIPDIRYIYPRTIESNSDTRRRTTTPCVTIKTVFCNRTRSEPCYRILFLGGLKQNENLRCISVGVSIKRRPMFYLFAVYLGSIWNIRKKTHLHYPISYEADSPLFAIWGPCGGPSVNETLPQ